MNHRIATTLALLALVAAPLSARQDPPKPDAAQAKLQEPKPAIYDEKADAKSDIAAAVARAKKDNQRVLIMWGGNWCGWCRLLHATMKSDPAVAKKLLYEYQVVMVDIGKFNKNLDLAIGYGKDLTKGETGVPFLTVLDADGKMVVNQATGPFELADKTKPGHDPKLVIDFLTQHAATPLDAPKVYAAALEQARKENKAVFLHFGAPWCAWCHSLENWMARPEISAILSKHFVDVKIDQDRMANAAELQKLYPQSTTGGIPWFVFLDTNGKELANSTLDKQSTGFPSSDAEVAWFAQMLKTVPTITPAEIQTLTASLVAEREAREAREKAAKTSTPAPTKPTN